jgi:hypothetical protein
MFVPKTDETRLQGNPKFLELIKGRNIVITRKEDGCSCTFIYNGGEFSMCSRNCKLDEEPDSNTAHYFHIKDKFNIQNSIAMLGKNIAIQGEIVGGKVNGNRLKLTTYDFRVFNVYDIDTQSYLNWNDITNICQTLKLNTVPLIYIGNSNDIGFELTVDSFLNLAKKQLYLKGVLAEGIVIKTDDSEQRFSFKVISNEYLLKHDL